MKEKKQEKKKSKAEVTQKIRFKVLNPPKKTEDKVATPKSPCERWDV